MVQRHKRGGLSQKSFTLIELIVTVAILSFGIVTIYEALFVSVDAFGFYTNYLNTQDWISEKISEAEAELIQLKTLEIGKTEGQITRNHKKFQWVMIVGQVSNDEGLYKVDVTLSWREGNKKVETSRAAYLLLPQLKPYNEEGFTQENS